MITFLIICALLVVGVYLLIRLAPAKFEALLQIIVSFWDKLQSLLKIQSKDKATDSRIESAQNQIYNLKKCIEQIEEQKKDLEEKNSTLSILNDSLLSQSTAEKKGKEMLQQQLDDLLDGSILLSQFVSCSFCEEYKQIAKIIDAGIYSILVFLETLSRSKEEGSLKLIDEIVELLRNSLSQESVQHVKQWFYSLDTAKVIKGQAVIDLKSKRSEDTQLTYLRQNAFLDYYRPVLSSLLLVLEHVRYLSPELSSKATKYIKYINETIKEFGFEVLYIPTGTVYEGDDFSTLDINAISNASAPSNYVSKVIKIGINSKEFTVPIEKTIIEMNI